MSVNIVGTNVSQIGNPLLSHGNTKPTSLSESESYCILEITCVVSSPTTLLALNHFILMLSWLIKSKFTFLKVLYSAAKLLCTVCKQGMALDRLLDIKLYALGPQ